MVWVTTGTGIGLGSTRPMLVPLSRSSMPESLVLEKGPRPSIISLTLLRGSSIGRSISGIPLCNTVEYKKARIEVDREISRLKEDTTEDMDRKKLEEVADKLEIDYGSMTDEEIRNAIETEINNGNKYLNNLVMYRDLLKHKTRMVQFH